MYLRTMMITGLSCLAIACGSDSDSNKDKQDNKNVDEFGLVGSGDASANNEGLKGNGDVLFNDSLGSVESGKRFELKFTLAADSVLNVVTYAGKDLTGGIEFEFAREGDHLHAEILSGGEHAEVGDHFEVIDPAGTIEIAIEVHNDESPAHVLIENLIDDIMLVDSEADHEGHDHGEHEEGEHHEEEGHEDHEEGEEGIVHANGTDSFWGLRLTDGVIVNTAKAVEAESGH